MKVIDWTKIYKKYKGQWVALKDDEQTVVSYGTTVKKVMEQSRKKGFETPILFKVPTKIMPFVGNF